MLVVGREEVNPASLCTFGKKVTLLSVNWRNTAAFSDFHTWGRIKLTIYIKLQCTCELECFKFIVTQFVELVKYLKCCCCLRNTGVGSVQHRLTVSSEKGQLLRRQDDSEYLRDPDFLGDPVSESMQCIETLFLDPIWWRQSALITYLLKMLSR